MIVVTGANGFIGSALVGELNRRGLSDLILSDLVGQKIRPALLNDKNFHSLVGPQELLQQLQEGSLRPEWVLHMGACSDTTETNWDFLLRTNVTYSQELFKWCAENAVPLIYASSGAVYGDGSKSFNDQADLNVFEPLNLYGRSKLEVDQWVLSQEKTPPHWYGLRFFNVYGPNENFKEAMSSVVFKAYGQIKETGQLRLFRSSHPDYKDGEQMRDFIYIKDVLRWIFEIMDVRPQSGIYNMGSGVARTWLDLADQCFKSLGHPTKISWIDLPEELSDKYQYFTRADMNHWRHQGLSPSAYSLEEGVADYIENYLEKQRFL